MTARLLPLFLVGCATAGTPDKGGGSQTDASNSHVFEDAAEVTADAPKVFMDACVPTPTELLKNPSFDLDPIGTMWTESATGLVTAQDGVTEQSAPYKAWLGGLTSFSDTLYQDVTVPASTTSLVLTGYYWVATAESGGVFDTASVKLTQTSGTPIETVMAFTEASKTTTWTAINHTFTNPSAGQTVRLMLTSTNDSTLPTSFYFDTLSLQATACP
ncbi:hypothetical protein BH11MYX1_BH11MYX1_35890 [soil metagenome]